MGTHLFLQRITLCAVNKEDVPSKRKRKKKKYAKKSPVCVGPKGARVVFGVNNLNAIV